MMEYIERLDVIMSRRSSGRKRRTASGAVDKWRNKMWVDIRAPSYVADKSLGKTPASDLESVIGRTVKISLMDLTNSFKDLNYHLTFKITELDGMIGRTEFFQHELSRDYRRAQIRNHRSKIDGIFNLKLKDKSKIRVTVFVVTPVRATASIKKEIRRVMNEKMEEICAELTFPEFVNKLISHELKKELLPFAEEIFDIKILDISKVKVLRFPMEEIPVEV